MNSLKCDRKTVIWTVNCARGWRALLSCYIVVQPPLYRIMLWRCSLLAFLREVNNRECSRSSRFIFFVFYTILFYSKNEKQKRKSNYFQRLLNWQNRYIHITDDGSCVRVWRSVDETGDPVFSPFFKGMMIFWFSIVENCQVKCNLNNIDLLI